MSHFTVLVTETNKKDIEQQLSPFDENREMAMHISETKAELIQQGRRTMQRAQDKYTEWQKDPAAYEASCSNPGHMKWLRDEVPALIEALEKNDEKAFYDNATSWYDPEELDSEGNHITTNNDDAKWDWYSIGGRWAGFFESKPGIVGVQGHHRAKDFAAISGNKVEDLPESACDVIQVKSIDWAAMDNREKTQRAAYWDEQMAEPEEKNRFKWADNRDELLKMSRDDFINRPIRHSTFAVLHRGKWYERGSMGWWGIVSDEKDTDKWDEEFKNLISNLDPETEVTVVDCHI